MKFSSFLYFAGFGVKTVLFRKKDPILGTVILTDKRNLECLHCSVNNITAVIHPYAQIREEMQQLFAMGARILFFCGGETFLWQDRGKTLRDLVVEAKADCCRVISQMMDEGTSVFNLKSAFPYLIHNTFPTPCYQIRRLKAKKKSHQSVPWRRDPCCSAHFKVPAMAKKEKHRLLDQITEYCLQKGYSRTSIWTFSNQPATRYSSMTRDNFLGFGCSATTLLKDQFKINTFSVPEYCRRIDEEKLPTSLTLRFSLRQRMIYYLFWTAYSTEVRADDFERFFGASLKSMYRFGLSIAKLAGFLTEQEGVYRMTPKGAFYYHYYENFYTLAYIDKMWGIMRQQAFPAGIEL